MSKCIVLILSLLALSSHSLVYKNAQGSTTILVERNATTKFSIHPSVERKDDPLQKGQVRVHIVKLAITSNTLVYALAGEHPTLRYFDHFPVPSDVSNPKNKYAQSPAWGTGVVVASHNSEVPTGTRIHGFFPVSQYVVLTPQNVTGAHFMDAAPHRQHLTSYYNTYDLHDGSRYKGLTGDKEDWQTANDVLFMTGWSMAMHAAQHPSKPTALVLTSASSRTSQGASFAAKFHKLPFKVIGITSKKHIENVRNLGTYDTVLSYDNVQSLIKQKTSIYDVAGNADVKKALYEHLGKDIVYYGSVGMTNVQHASKYWQVSLEGLSGSPLEPFLVFPAMEGLAKAYGEKEVYSMHLPALAAFRSQSLKSFHVIRQYGPEETLQVLDDMVKDQIKPDDTYICSLWPKDSYEPIA